LHGRFGLYSESLQLVVRSGSNVRQILHSHGTLRYKSGRRDTAEILRSGKLFHRKRNLGNNMQHHGRHSKMSRSQFYSPGSKTSKQYVLFNDKLLTLPVLYSSKTKTWKLSDFGIALKLPASVPVVPSGLPSPPLTPTGEYTTLPPPGSNISLTKRGSPGYVAPELLYSGICSRKGDVWSIGCILYELACGKMAFPFTGSGFALSPEDPLRRYYCGEGDKDLPEVLRPDNPLIMRCVGNNYFGGPVSGRYRINQVISWCLERDANDRPKIGRLVNHVKSIVWQQE